MANLVKNKILVNIWNVEKNKEYMNIDILKNIANTIECKYPIIITKEDLIYRIDETIFNIIDEPSFDDMCNKLSNLLNNQKNNQKIYISNYFGHNKKDSDYDLSNLFSLKEDKSDDESIYSSSASDIDFDKIDDVYDNIDLDTISHESDEFNDIIYIE
jgi:hypothetical protein